MEISADPVKTSEDVTKRKGGFITIPFVLANEAFERVASVGLHVNMILYLKGEYHFDSATGASILFWWAAMSNFLPTLGAFLSDSYLGRFHVIALGSLVSLIGQAVLWLTAILPQARPSYCKNYLTDNCAKPDAGQLVFLFSAFALMSIGAGGIRPCSLAFGADQFDNPKNPNNGRILQSFFNWYYASVALAVMIAVILIVYIQTEYGWVIGFGVPVGLMVFSTFMFFLGSKLYVKVNADRSMLSGFAQVIAVAWKNRHLPLPTNDDLSDTCFYHDKNSKLTHPTQRLRFLNKACMVRDSDQDSSIQDPWKCCTVEQVENFKVLIKILPMWSTGIMIAVTTSQFSFMVLQAVTMDRGMAGDLKIPPATLAAFTVLTLGIWVAVYDRLLVKHLAKYTRDPRGLSFKQRMGIGLFVSCISTAVAALVEGRRRTADLKDGLVDMSVFWLAPQLCLIGLAEAFNAIGQIEFYYSCFPKSMSSIGVSLFALGSAVGNLVASFIVAVVNRISERGGRLGWVSNDLNKGHYDYYYWILCTLSVVNFTYFILLNFFGNDHGGEKDGRTFVNNGDCVDEKEAAKTKEEESTANTELV